MKTPKQRFLETPEAKSFLQTVNQPDTQKALEYALLQFIHENPAQGFHTDNFRAAADNYRLEGARKLISILQELPVITPPTRTTPLRDNLEA